MNMNVRQNSWYNCPECNWNPDNDIEHMAFYYIKNGKAVSLENSWDEEDKDGSCKINYNEIKKIFKEEGVKVYPVRKDGRSCMDWYSGVSGESWIEVHCCPNCNEEFEFENSTI